MIVQNISERSKTTDITFTIPKDDLSNAEKIMDLIKDDVPYESLLIDSNIAKISIIGVGMITTPGVTYRMFQTLANKRVNIQVISTSEIKISVLINKKNSKKALAALHKEFKLNK